MPKATTRSAAPKAAPFPAQMMSRALPMQLLRAREAVMQRFRPTLRDLGLTDQQGRIMRALAEVEWIDMMALAGRCCIHPASLSRTVPRLVARGLLRRRPDPQDARRMTVALTAKGRSTFWNVWVESERIYGALAEQLGAANLEALHRSLEALIESLGGDAATVPPGGEE
ncbi:MAG TPA: MarR family transcriptional regulator [Stellaceae bacterium]|nr:MarR family transcriptional regulator [Stellaceae bacterium]